MYSIYLYWYKLIDYFIKLTITSFYYYLFWRSDCSRFAQGKFLQFGQCVLHHSLICFLILGTVCSRVILCFLCSESDISPESSGSFNRRIVSRRHDLDTRCAHCYWGIAAPGLCNRLCYGIYVYRDIHAYMWKHLHLHLYSHIHIYFTSMFNSIFAIYIENQHFHSPIFIQHQSSF